jgi:hypothetical protein
MRRRARASPKTGGESCHISYLRWNSRLTAESDIQDGFAYNNATSEGGDIYNLAYGDLSFVNGAFTANVTMYNTILASGSASPVIHGLVNQQFSSGNTAGGLPQNTGNSATISGSNNLVPFDVSNLNGTDSGLVNAVPTNSNPIFLDTSPTNNGGPTPTLAINTQSAAFGAGDNSAPGLSALTDDQRGAGFPRMPLGTVDVGAFAVQPVFSDNFNRGNSPTLGSKWQQPELLPALGFMYRRQLFGGFEVQNNEGVSPAAPLYTVTQVTGQSLLNPTVVATVNASAGQAVGVAARIQANGDAYVAALTNDGVAEILLYHAAAQTYTVLQSASAGGTSQTLLFVLNGSTLSLFIGSNSTPLITVTDNTLTSAGGVGLFAQGSDGIVTEFGVLGS